MSRDRGTRSHDDHRPGPEAGRTGTEPVTARSPLGLRLVLSAVYVPVFLVATVGFAIWAAHSDPGSSPTGTVLSILAGGCAVLTVVAAADLLVVLRRRRRGPAGTPPGRPRPPA